jgi:hypothetical protein
MEGRAGPPGADEVVRGTGMDGGGGRPAAGGAPAAASAERTSSGRQRHEEKVTFYCTAEELTDLEHARLQLRREHGIGVDRGRIVRAALAQVLSELERDGAESALVKRLRR